MAKIKKPKSKKVKFSFKGKVNKAVAKREAESKGFSYLTLPDGVSMYKPVARKGKSDYINIIPYMVSIDNHPDKDVDNDMAIKGTPWFQLPIKVHENVGAEGSGKKIICPTTFGKKCPICEHSVKRAKQGADWEELKTYKPKDRMLYVIQEIQTNSKNDTEFSIMDMSIHLFQKMLDAEIAENSDYECYPDLEGGFTLKIRWNEKEIVREVGKIKYSECGRIDFEERDDLDPDIIEEAPCLDKIVNVLDYKTLEKLFFDGIVDEEDREDIDEDEQHTPKKSYKSKTPFIDEEEEDIDEEEEEEEVIEKPKRKKKTTAPKKAKKQASKKTYTWDNLEDMDAVDLSEVAKSNGIEFDEEDEEDEEALRTLVAEGLNIDIPEQDDVEDGGEEEDIDEEEEDIDEEEEDIDEEEEDIDEEEEDIDEEEEVIEKPKRKKKTTAPKKAKKEASKKAKKEAPKNVCPDGGTFGKDFEERTACADCPLWDECYDKSNE